MKDFVISTESNSDLDLAYLAQNNIIVIPHYYSVEEKVYGDENELTIKEFYDSMRAQKKVQTMASNPAIIEEKFKEALSNDKDILHISFTSALSGGYGNIVMVANQIMEENPDCKIEVLDTLAASLGEGLLIMKAVELKNQGKTLQETLEVLKEMIPHVCAVFTVDDLNHLYRGGRLSKTSAIVGTLVNIKPILHVNDEGKLAPLNKVRGRKKSIGMLVDYMIERVGDYKDKQVNIGLIHGDSEEDVMYLKQLVEEKISCKNFIIRPIGPSVGAHSGPGTIGLIFIGDHR